MTQSSLPISTVQEIRDQCLCLATQRAARLLARRFDRLFAPLGLTNGQFSMLVALSGQWKPLEKRRLVMLLPDEADARVRRPGLTDAGRAVVAQAVPLWRAEHALVNTEMAGQDPAELAQILRQLG